MRSWAVAVESGAPRREADILLADNASVRSPPMTILRSLTGAAALTFLFAAVMPMAWVFGIGWNLYLDRLYCNTHLETIQLMDLMSTLVIRFL